MRSLFIAPLIVPLTVICAWAFDAMDEAQKLGYVLGAEEACGLSYDQQAIQSYIEKHVPPDNTDFNADLEGMVGFEKMALEQASQSQKTAMCTQNERVARHFGFIK